MTTINEPLRKHLIDFLSFYTIQFDGSKSINQQKLVQEAYELIKQLQNLTNN